MIDSRGIERNSKKSTINQDDLANTGDIKLFPKRGKVLKSGNHLGKMRNGEFNRGNSNT